jgi:hypothetical protein
MKIKKFREFESISGWELVGTGFGPGSPRQELAVSLSSSNTQTLLGKDGKIYTYDDYEELYNQYQKEKGSENLKEFNQLNLDKVIQYIKSIRYPNVD